MPLVGTTEFWTLMDERRRAGVCANCGKRPRSIAWGDALAMTHGGGESRCGVCVYGAQLRHAFNRAVRIPMLAAKLTRAWMTRS